MVIVFFAIVVKRCSLYYLLEVALERGGCHIILEIIFFIVHN